MSQMVDCHNRPSRLDFWVCSSIWSKWKSINGLGISPRTVICSGCWSGLLGAFMVAPWENGWSIYHWSSIFFFPSQRFSIYNNNIINNIIVADGKMSRGNCTTDRGLSVKSGRRRDLPLQVHRRVREYDPSQKTLYIIKYHKIWSHIVTHKLSHYKDFILDLQYIQ